MTVVASVDRVSTILIPAEAFEVRRPVEDSLGSAEDQRLVGKVVSESGLVLPWLRKKEARNLVKHTALSCVLVLSACAWAGLNPNSAEYTINVHVTKSRMILRDTSISYQQMLDVVIDGKKYDLESVNYPNTLLVLGDYKAKLVKDEHRGGYDSFQVYEFLFSDRKTRQFRVVGETE